MTARERTGPWRFADGSAPSAPHVAAMTVRDGLFVHWPVDPAALRARVPEPLSLETFEGEAWVSVLPFVLTDVGLRGTPSVARTAVAELNVRTYVRYRGDPGLYFFSVDLGSAALAAAAGGVTRLPVFPAKMRVDGDGRRISFSSARQGTEPGAPAEFAATYRPAGDAATPDPGTLDHWLTERRRFYAPSGRGVLAAEVAHEPWPLRPAEATVRENTMLAAADLPAPTGEPIVHYCERMPMTGSVPRRLPGR